MFDAARLFGLLESPIVLFLMYLGILLMLVLLCDMFEICCAEKFGDSEFLLFS